MFFLSIGVTLRYPCVNGLYPLELWTLVFYFTGFVYDSLLVVYSWGREGGVHEVAIDITKNAPFRH